MLKITGLNKKREKTLNTDLREKKERKKINSCVKLEKCRLKPNPIKYDCILSTKCVYKNCFYEWDAFHRIHTAWRFNVNQFHLCHTAQILHKIRKYINNNTSYDDDRCAIENRMQQSVWESERITKSQTNKDIVNATAVSVMIASFTQHLVKLHSLFFSLSLSLNATVFCPLFLLFSFPSRSQVWKFLFINVNFFCAMLSWWCLFFSR